MHEKEREKIIEVLKQLPREELSILQQILYKEKDYLHRSDMRGTSIISDIENIVKENVRKC